MKFGLCLPTFSFPDLDFATAGRIRDFATRAEALGYDALWVPERHPARWGRNARAGRRGMSRAV